MPLDYVVTKSEVALKIDKETELVCNMAATMICNGVEYGVAIKDSFMVLDRILSIQEDRFGKRIQEEYKRRSGY